MICAREEKKETIKRGTLFDQGALTEPTTAKAFLHSQSKAFKLIIQWLFCLSVLYQFVKSDLVTDLPLIYDTCA